MAAIIQTPAINGTAPNGAGTGLDAVPKNTLNGTPLYNPNLVNGTQLNGGQNIEAIANGAIEPFKVLCGPLLNFKRMSSNASRRPIWHGSILLVTEPGGSDYPELSLSSAGTISANAAVERGVEGTATTDSRRIRPVRLFEDPQKLFLRYTFEILLQDSETEWRYTLPNTRHHTRPANGRSASWSFIVPAAEQSMRIMFHSCNGFSVGTDEAAWSGPALWNDVLRMHEKKPFHVMIGGGDQIYNDGVRVKGPLKAWTDIGNPKKRRDFPFQESLRADCDKYYFDNYVKWFSTAPFADANSRIPQVNIWDDHGLS